MNSSDPVTGKQIAAGRMLAGVSRAQLSRLSSVSEETLKFMEASDEIPTASAKDLLAVHHELEKLGVIFIPEDKLGAGVRLRFTRSEVRQINRLESEGGVAGDDDV